MNFEDRILNEITDFRKEVKELFVKVFDRIDAQNVKIISSEKDIEYLKIDRDKFFKNFKEFKLDEIPRMVDAKSNKLKLWVVLNFVGLLLSIIGVLVRDLLR